MLISGLTQLQVYNRFCLSVVWLSKSRILIEFSILYNFPVLVSLVQSNIFINDDIYAVGLNGFIFLLIAGIFSSFLSKLRDRVL